MTSKSHDKFKSYSNFVEKNVFFPPLVILRVVFQPLKEVLGQNYQLSLGAVHK